MHKIQLFQYSTYSMEFGNRLKIDDDTLRNYYLFYFTYD